MARAVLRLLYSRSGAPPRHERKENEPAVPLNIESTQAVVFDYGNTLVPFGREEIAKLDAALQAGLARHFPAPDLAAVAAIRDRNRMAPYAGDPPAYRENDLNEITEGLVRELYGVEPRDGVVRDLIEVRNAAFQSVLHTPDYVAPLLARLKHRYRLALLSNYPSGRSIREGLERGDLARFFDAVVVSGDLGYCKPHPSTFAAVEQALGLSGAALLYVGDNWLADVQGAKRAGWRMVLTRQWQPPETFARDPDHFEPDAAIGHLAELEQLLMVAS